MVTGEFPGKVTLVLCGFPGKVTCVLGEFPGKVTCVLGEFPGETISRENVLAPRVLCHPHREQHSGFSWSKREKRQVCHTIATQRKTDM